MSPLCGAASAPSRLRPARGARAASTSKDPNPSRHQSTTLPPQGVAVTGPPPLHKGSATDPRCTDEDHNDAIVYALRRDAPPHPGAGRETLCHWEILHVIGFNLPRFPYGKGEVGGLGAVINSSSWMNQDEPRAVLAAILVGVPLRGGQRTAPRQALRGEFTSSSSPKVRLDPPR